MTVPVYPTLPADQIIDTPMDFDSLGKLRSGLGTAYQSHDEDFVRAMREVARVQPEVQSTAQRSLSRLSG